jgi:hypothetical protein
MEKEPNIEDLVEPVPDEWKKLKAAGMCVVCRNLKEWCTCEDKFPPPLDLDLPEPKQ